MEKLFIGYGRKNIIPDLNLRFDRGGFTALAGRNGCGKSTLLQSFVGLSDIQSGSLEWNKDYGLPAFIFQNPEHQFIFPTVEEEINSSSGSEIAIKTEKLLREYGLWEKRKQNPHTLSGGEKRRLSLAAMLSQEHLFYLLDEPTFGQDARTAREIVKSVRELNEMGKTIIMVSHDLSVFQNVLTRIIVMNEGRIVFDDSPQRLSACTPEQRNQWGVEL